MSDETFNMDQEIDRFKRALLYRWMNGRKDFTKIAASNFGGVINNLFGLTPPMWSSFIRPGPGVDKKGGGVQVDFEQGRRASDRTIQRDVNRATWTLKGTSKFKNKDIPSRGMEVVSAYLKCRNSRKRYAGGFPRKPISESDKLKIVEFLKNRQGYTPGGWVNAARFFLVPVAAAWVRRWASKSGGTGGMEILPGQIYMFAKNPTKHYNANQMQQRVAIALRMQVNVIYRDFKFWADSNLSNI